MKVYCSECKWFEQDCQGCNAPEIKGNWYSREVKRFVKPAKQNFDNDCKWWEGK